MVTANLGVPQSRDLPCYRHDVVSMVSPLRCHKIIAKHHDVSAPQIPRYLHIAPIHRSIIHPIRISIALLSSLSILQCCPGVRHTPIYIPHVVYTPYLDLLGLGIIKHFALLPPRVVNF